MALHYDETMALRRPLLFDGATGTELERMGAPCTPPLWSAQALIDAPEAVQQIHEQYVDAGCAYLTANTFRTQACVLAQAGLDSQAKALTQRAVEIARIAAARARPEAKLRIVGSAPPLGDCYRPEETPSENILLREHQLHAEHLAAAGVDEILAETHITIREATIASRAAYEAGLPCRTTFVTHPQGQLLSGESLTAAIEAVAPYVVAVGLNCIPVRDLECALPLLQASGIPFGVQANLGAPGDTPQAPRSHARSPSEFAQDAVTWVHAGASFIGGCCGTTPAHLAAVASLFGKSS